MKVGDRVKANKRYEKFGPGVIVGFSTSDWDLVGIRFDSFTDYLDDDDEDHLDRHYVGADELEIIESNDDIGWPTVVAGAAAALLGASLLGKHAKQREHILPEDKTKQVKG